MSQKPPAMSVLKNLVPRAMVPSITLIHKKKMLCIYVIMYVCITQFFVFCTGKDIHYYYIYDIVYRSVVLSLSLCVGMTDFLKVARRVNEFQIGVATGHSRFYKQVTAPSLFLSPCMMMACVYTYFKVM